MTLLANGNFGIGTATPTSKLDVKGEIRVSGATSGYVGLAVPAVAGSTTYTFPVAPLAGKFLKTDGSGGLTWDDPVGSGDMTKTTYDIGNNGKADVADNADLLGGQAGAYYLNAANLTGSVADVRLSANVSLLGPSIASNEITDATIVAADMAPDTITAGEIATDAVDTAEIKNGAVTDAKVAAISGGKITSGTVGRSFLQTMTGDAGAGGASGAVPAPGAGDAAANKYLKANGTWATVTAGAVSSLDAADGSPTQVVNVDNTGLVGIGTTTPANRLTVVDGGAVANNGHVMALHADDSNVFMGALYNDTYSPTTPVMNYWADNAGGFAMGTNVATPFMIYTNGWANPRVAIDATGKVGIGTTAPSEVLHVYSASNANLELDGSSASGIVLARDGSPKWSLYSTGSSSDLFRIGIWGVADVMTFDRSYRVGIGRGMTAPTATLHVKDGTASTGVSRLLVQEGAGQSTSEAFGVYANDGTTPRLVIQNGNVGIGTTSPTEKLTVDSSTRGALSFGVGGFAAPPSGAATSVGTKIRLFESQNAANVDYALGINAGELWSTSNGSFAWYTGNGGAVPLERMRILTNGKVGIGTSNPLSALDVNGQIRAKSGTNANGAIDWDNGNSITSSFACGSNVTFANLRDGGSYTLVVTDTGTTQCSFDTTTTGADANTVTYRFKPVNAARTTTSHTVYSIQRVGNEVYVSWNSGF